MRRSHKKSLSALVPIAIKISDQTLRHFGNLTSQQLNWKPDADQWSIAQCFDHLVTANADYFPIFDKLLSGEGKNTAWEKLPLLPSFCGKLVLKAVSPETARKRKNPKIFNPSSSGVDENIILRFIDQQNDLVGYMKATEEFELEKIIISSPVSRLITYSLMDAYRIMVSHEERHLLQAVRVLEMDRFPNSIPQPS